MTRYLSPEEFLRSTILKMVQPNAEEWEAFVSELNERPVKKNEVYLNEGEICRKVAFIVQGCFKMYYIINGEEYCKDFQFEGQFTGSVYSLLSQQPSRFFVAAIEDSLILEMSRDCLFRLYDQYKIWERLGRMYMEQNFIKKEAREASLLLDSSATRYKNLLQQHPDFFKRLPQKYIASFLGITTEYLSKLRRNKTARKS